MKYLSAGETLYNALEDVLSSLTSPGPCAAPVKPAPIVEKYLECTLSDLHQIYNPECPSIIGRKPVVPRKLDTDKPHEHLLYHLFSDIAAD